MKRRVVITGLGIASPFGVGNEPFFHGLKEGREAIGRLTRFPCDDYKVQIGALLPPYDPALYIADAITLKRSNQVTEYALVAAKIALDDAGVGGAEGRAEIGVCLGTGMGGIQTTEEAYYGLFVDKKPISPVAIPMAMANAPASQVSITFGLRGPNLTTSTACSASGHATGLAFDLIAQGVAERMLAGGSEAPLYPGSLNAWISTRVMSMDNDTPGRACRPFSANRPGMVLGEGACLYLLEEYEAAKRRGAKIYAEVLGWGLTADAFNITAPEPQGQVAVMRMALQRAGIKAADVGYIAAHGTGTKLNDKTESAAIREVFGAKPPPLSSIKSMIGHTLGASSAFGVASAFLPLLSGIMPPTIHHEEADPECPFDCIPNRARPCGARVAMINSFGFGGSNATLLLAQNDASLRENL